MYSYGHGSWIALVILGGVLLVRLLSRGRRDERRGQGPASSFFAPPPAPPAGPPAVRTTPPAGEGTGDGVAPGWFTDPTGRHAQRYWSGSAWTEHVLDDGVPGTDPPPAPPGSAGRQGS